MPPTNILDFFNFVFVEFWESSTGRGDCITEPFSFVLVSMGNAVLIVQHVCI
jgi:hypothetical protein